MTKYILHGGNSREINNDNESFFSEMTRESRGRTRILLNYFSRKDEEIEKIAEEDKVRFIQNSNNKDLVFEIADDTRLAEQLERSQVMYMRGGETVWLVETKQNTKCFYTIFE